MKALVTGAHGFAGRYLVRHLREMGDDVVELDRGGEHGVDVVDRAGVHTVIDAHRPDVVYHLAAFTHVGESWSVPTEVLRVNVEGTANVLDAARAADVGRVVVIGSAEEYGRAGPDGSLSEDTPVQPTSPYAASKAAASLLALQAHLGAGLDTVRVRPFNHTGPGQPPKFLVPALAHRIAAAERDAVDDIAVGSLDPVRDLSDVRDVVRAYRLLAEHGTAGEVYNVCSGQGVTVRDVAEQLVGLATRPLRLTVDPALVRPVDVPRLVGDGTRLRAATGWEPAYSLAETLRDVLDAARAALS